MWFFVRSRQHYKNARVLGQIMQQSGGSATPVKLLRFSFYEMLDWADRLLLATKEIP
jgi:hypothetical protein